MRTIHPETAYSGPPPAAPTRPVPRGAVLPVGVMVALVAAVTAGFARSYYFKAWFDQPALSMLVHAHALLMTGWIALFALQVWLVRTARVRWHRSVGWLAAGWFATLVAVAAVTTIAAARHGWSPHPDLPPLAFMAQPATDLAVFTTLVVSGLACRQYPGAHRRLMLLSALALLPPALARVPLALCQAPAGFLGLTAAAVLLCVAVDSLVHRRLHPAAAGGAALLLLSLPARLVLGDTAAWQLFAGWLTA